MTKKIAIDLKFILYLWKGSLLTTKEKILAAALKMFNQEGYGAVNLFELAKSIGMSRGNMTFHFRDKEAILQTLAEELWQ